MKITEMQTGTNYKSIFIMTPDDIYTSFKITKKLAKQIINEMKLNKEEEEQYKSIKLKHYTK